MWVSPRHKVWGEETDGCRTGFRWLLDCTKRVVCRSVRLQETARLTRADLVRSTEMFGRLADPNGANNALSQVLYGLALRCHPPFLPLGPQFTDRANKGSGQTRLGLRAERGARGPVPLARGGQQRRRRGAGARGGHQEGRRGQGRAVARALRAGQLLPPRLGRGQGRGGGAAVLRDGGQHGRPRGHERGGVVLPRGVRVQEGQGTLFHTALLLAKHLREMAKRL
jgi:hypothetical protein